MSSRSEPGIKFVEYLQGAVNMFLRFLHGFDGRVAVANVFNKPRHVLGVCPAADGEGEHIRVVRIGLCVINGWKCNQAIQQV